MVVGQQATRCAECIESLDLRALGTIDQIAIVPFLVGFDFEEN